MGSTTVNHDRGSVNRYDGEKPEMRILRGDKSTVLTQNYMETPHHDRNSSIPQLPAQILDGLARVVDVAVVATSVVSKASSTQWRLMWVASTIKAEGRRNVTWQDLRCRRGSGGPG